MTEPGYDAILFDNDGVLIELTERHRLREAARRSFAAFDVTAEERFVEAATHEDELAFDAIAETHGIDPGEWWARREAHAVAVQREDIEAGRKSLYDDVAAIRELDQDLAVVSNNQHETIEFILDHHDFAGQFETFYGRDPTIDGFGRKKPDPYYLERALDDLGTRSALYVGDSEKDVVAAERAGIDSAFLRREHRLDLTLATEPTYEFADLRSLVDAVATTSRAD